MNMQLVNLLFILLHFYGVKTDRKGSCKTPEVQPGECISIKNCPPLYSLLKIRPILQKHENFLKQSHCGFEGRIPKVCCPIQTNEIGNRADMPEDDVLPPPPHSLLPGTDVCGVDFGRRILGGAATDLDEFPWMALLLYKIPSGRLHFGCGGVLISDRYVLTAAHCLKGKDLPKDWNLTQVRLGEYNKDSDRDCKNNGFNTECLKIPPYNVIIEEAIAHEKYDPYDPDQANDIALLRLSRKVEYTDYVKPICLPILDQERRRSYVGLNLTVAGWGQTENRSSSSVKLKLLVPVVENSECTSLYSDANYEVTEKQICAGGQEKKDSCRGDSGGPLMCLGIDDNGDTIYYLVGVVSFGPVPCGEKNWPAVYTKVSKYMGWILRHMKP